MGKTNIKWEPVGRTVLLKGSVRKSIKDTGIIRPSYELTDYEFFVENKGEEVSANISVGDKAYVNVFSLDLINGYKTDGSDIYGYLDYSSIFLVEKQ
jgi:hypothetical protein